MKKIFSLTGIMVMAVIVSTSAFAGNTGINTATSTGISSPSGQPELGVLAGNDYADYEYRHSGGKRSGGNRDRHRGGRGSWGRCWW